MPESIWCREHQIEVAYVRSGELSREEYVRWYGVDPKTGKMKIPQQPPAPRKPEPPPGKILTPAESAWLRKIIREAKAKRENPPA